MKTVIWRLALIGLVLAVAIWHAWPRPDEGRPFMNMRLGLDLKGGSHLMMQVMTDDALKAQADVTSTRMAELLRAEGYSQARGTSTDVPGEVLITSVEPARAEDARLFLDEEFDTWNPVLGEDGIRAMMPLRDQDHLRDQAVRQVLSTIQNRIDEFGVAEPNIQRVESGDRDRILVELPGVENPSRVKKLIQVEAQLEFRMAYYAPDGSGAFVAPTKDGVVALLGGTLPIGVEVLPEEEVNKETGERAIVRWYAVEKSAIITGADLQDARVNRGQWGDHVVSFQCRVSAMDRLAKATRNAIGRQMPIILDGNISSAPVLRSELPGSGQIEGNYTYEEAEDQALVLRAGALPARVITLEERTVGPSLGWDSIQAGIRAAGIGFVLVMIFMLIYYRLSGVNAVVALCFNLLLVAAALAYFGASLTLPGIAGFILTVGMAVDANVLIFERIREELRSGKTVKGAIDGGFGKALSAILDANITTLIAAIFLFQYGTGPVRGFAVTLSVGIIASLFTAIFVSRTLFSLIIGDRAAQRLSI